MLCMVTSMPYGIWTGFWGNRWSPGASLPRLGSRNQLSSWTGSLHKQSAVCRRWMQEYTMSQRCSIGFRIALMPSSSRSYWHAPATWDRQQEELRPTAPESRQWVYYLGDPLWAADTACHESRNAMLAKKGWNHSLGGGFSPVHLWTVPLAKQHVKQMYYCFLTGQAGVPEGWLTGTCTVMILCSLYFFVQYKQAQTCWTFSSWSCCWCFLFSF